MRPEDVDNLLTNPPKDAVPPLRFFQSIASADDVRMCDANGRYWFNTEQDDVGGWREGNSGVSPDAWLSQADVWKEVYPPEEVHAEGCDGKVDCGLGCACECHPLEEAKEGDPIAANRTKWEGKIETLEKALDIAAKNYDNAEQRAAALTEERAELQSRLAAAEKTVADALAEASQVHEFEVAGKLHKVHHSDLVSVLQQVMEQSERRNQEWANSELRGRTMGESNRNLMAARDRLEQQLKAIRTMSKVV